MAEQDQRTIVRRLSITARPAPRTWIRLLYSPITQLAPTRRTQMPIQCRLAQQNCTYAPLQLLLLRILGLSRLKRWILTFRSQCIGRLSLINSAHIVLMGRDCSPTPTPSQGLFNKVPWDLFPV